MAALLRRWPVCALVLGASAGWGAMLVDGGGLSVVPWRAAGLVSAALVLLAPSRLRPHLWWLAAAAASVAMLWIWSGNRTLLAALPVIAGLTAGMLGAGALAGRDGRWHIAGIAGMSTVLLLALTGSVRLAGECALITAPMLVLLGRPVSTDAAASLGVLLGGSVGAGVVFSDLGFSAVVPVLCLLAGASRPWTGRWSLLLAVAAAVIGCAPVAADWVMNPPF